MIRFQKSPLIHNWCTNWFWNNNQTVIPFDLVQFLRSWLMTCPNTFGMLNRIISGSLPRSNGKLMVLKLLKAVFLTWRRSQRRSTWRHCTLESVGGKLSQHDLPGCYSSTSNPKRPLLVGHIFQAVRFLLLYCLCVGRSAFEVIF